MRIVKPSYFQCPNDLIDHWMPLLKEGELRILLIVIRKTFGWNKDKDYISYSLFEEISGLGRKAVMKSVQSLVEKGIIKKEITGIFGKEKVFYSLIVHETEQQKIESDQDPKDPPDQDPKDPPPGSLGSPQKTLTKDNVVCSVCRAQGCEGNCKTQEPEPNHESAFCERKDCQGTTYTASIQDVFTHAVKQRKNWTSREIEQGWKIFVENPNNVNNYINYIEGIINNLRQKQRNNYRNKQKQGRKCENTHTKQSNKPLPEKSEPITETNEAIEKQRLLTRLSQLGLKTK